MTLPLIYTLNVCSKAEKKWIINTVKNHNTDKIRVNQLIQLVREKGGIDYTQEKMIEYKNKAFAILENIPDTEAKEGLRDLVNYITERNY